MVTEIERVLDFAESFFKVSRKDVIDKNTCNDVSFARSVVFKYLHCDVGISMNKIAKYFDRNWRSIAYSISKSKCFNKHDESIYKEFVDRYKNSHT